MSQKVVESPSKLKERILPKNRFVNNKKMYNGKENGFRMGKCVDAELNRHYNGGNHGKGMLNIIKSVTSSKLFPYKHTVYKTRVVNFINKTFPGYKIQTQKNINCNVLNQYNLKPRVDFYGELGNSKISIEEKFTAIPKGPKFTSYYTKKLKGKYAAGTKAQDMMPNTVKTEWDLQAGVPSLVGIKCYVLIIHINLDITFYRVIISPHVYKMLYSKDVLHKRPIKNSNSKSRITKNDGSKSKACKKSKNKSNSKLKKKNKRKQTTKNKSKK